MIQIVPTSEQDLDSVLSLFQAAMDLQGKNGYKVWNEIDVKGLAGDIADKKQYKIIEHDAILCVFSVQHTDPLIWGALDRDDAIYLHRIVVNPSFKGQKQFEKVLQWAVAYAEKHQRRYVRMDTWAANHQLISYYKTFGFRTIGNYITPDSVALPLQNRNLEVTLLEFGLT